MKLVLSKESVFLTHKKVKPIHKINEENDESDDLPHPVKAEIRPSGFPLKTDSIPFPTAHSKVMVRLCFQLMLN